MQKIIYLLLLDANRPGDRLEFFNFIDLLLKFEDEESGLKPSLVLIVPGDVVGVLVPLNLRFRPVLLLPNSFLLLFKSELLLRLLPLKILELPLFEDGDFDFICKFDYQVLR